MASFKYQIHPKEKNAKYKTSMTWKKGISLSTLEF